MAKLDLEYGRQVLEELEKSGNKTLLKKTKEFTPVDDADFGAGNLEVKSVRKEDQIKVEMELQNSSFGFEYALLELAHCDSYIVREQLNERLEECRRVYFEAREYLAEHCPLRLEHLEAELQQQKLYFRTYRA